MENCFETFIFSTRSHTACQTHANANMDDGLHSNHRRVNASKLQALESVAISLSLFELSEEQKYDQFVQLIPVPSASVYPVFEKHLRNEVNCRQQKFYIL